MTFSNYNVNDEPIGRGGMGQVYLGTDSSGRRVAIKEMLAEYVTDVDLRKRFHQEVDILNQIEHQFIVKMYDSFEERGNLYLVMEYVEGETIEQRIKRQGAFKESEAIRLLTDILSALSYAHQKGYVHRDIKPSNIMIRPNGNICLLDFGIAKDMNRLQRITYMQTCLGTHGYMSPEQADGYDIDARSDIYSLGCLLFYMLTGRHAIEKQENDYKTCMAILQQPFPQAKVYNPELSDHIQQILNRATDKNMLKRFQSCREFELELSGGGTLIGNKQNDNTISVGRTGCDIVIPYIKVSGRHLDVEKRKKMEGQAVYYIKDRSTNGTIVNGKAIHNEVVEVSPDFGHIPIIFLAGEIELKWSDVEAAFAHKNSDRDQDPVGGAQPPPIPLHIKQEGEDATWQLVAVYIFAALGGLLGFVLGISVYLAKVKLPHGKKEHKYKQSHRTAALIGALLSVVSMIVWGVVGNML